MTFQITALPAEPFADLFALSDQDLAEHLAVRVIADAKPGYPCRVSLADAEVGEELILVNHQHQPSATPYRATHAVYVRKGARQARPAIGEVPEQLRSRMLSLRAFGDDGMIVTAELAGDAAIAPALDQLLAEPNVAYVQIHFAKFGCYAARAERA
jgi:hypothetical protein